MFRKIIFLLLVILINSAKPQADTAIISLKAIDSSIIQDVRYATTNNFTGKILYPSANVFIRKIVAEHLAEANLFFRTNYKLRIKIFDAFRPLFVQKLMWKILPDERYVADPGKGSKHNRGAAVDVTLTDENGNDLDMGTPYDDFTERASYASEDVTLLAKSNRKLLRTVMMQFGFLPFESEWWHFDFNGWEKFSILNSNGE